MAIEARGATDVGGAFGQVDSTVAVYREVNGGVEADVEPEANRYAASLVLAQRSVVVGMVAHGFEGLDESDPAEYGAVNTAGALFGCVLEAQFDGVHAQLLRKLVNRLLYGESGVGSAGRAVGGSLGLVDNHVVAVNGAVLYVVGGQGALGAGRDR